ncbi:MAG TPA: hypothetical protein VGC65_02835 [Bacteroidia bacterium]|jgi:hypothetical protein
METSDNFRYLPIEEKAALLKQEGKYVTTMDSHGLKISLYAYKGMYVEVFNVKINDKLVAVRILDDKKRLGFYSRNVDLQTLLNQSLLGLLLFSSYYDNA